MAYRKILNNIVKDKIAEYKNVQLPKNADFSYFDVVLHGTTIASLSLYIFKLMFIREKEIALVSENGYMDLTNQSKIAIAYMDYLNKNRGKKIVHRDNGGEKMFGKWRVDGFDEREKTVYQIQGC